MTGRSRFSWTAESVFEMGARVPVHKMRVLFAAALLTAAAHPALAQQRPLLTEDPEPIGAGRLLFEGGVELSRSQQFPASGLEGNVLRAPTIGLSVGLSSIAELQI